MLKRQNLPLKYWSSSWAVSAKDKSFSSRRLWDDKSLNSGSETFQQAWFRIEHVSFLCATKSPDQSCYPICMEIRLLKYWIDKAVLNIMMNGAGFMVLSSPVILVLSISLSVYHSSPFTCSKLRFRIRCTDTENTILSLCHECRCFQPKMRLHDPASNEIWMSLNP